MAVKDFILGEDTSLPKEEATTGAASTQKEAAPEEPNASIKNAHASGDGSFGRNDESLSDEPVELPAKEGDGY